MKKWLRIGLTIVLALVIAFVGISAYMGYSMTRVERHHVQRNPGILGLEYEDVSFSSVEDDLKLRGWFLSSTDNESVIIMVHGNESNRDDSSVGMLDIASELINHGYNVLMFDLRGCGESEGQMVSAGLYEKRDLLGAVKYIKERDFEDIGVLGFSLGAVTSLLTVEEGKDVDAVVADSAFADLTDIMGPEFSRRTKAPEFMLPPMLFMIKLMYGVDFAAIKPVESVAETSIPIFFIHGTEDDTIPVEHAQRLEGASKNPESRLWIVSGAGHVRAYKTCPEEYIQKITDFFNSALE